MAIAEYSSEAQDFFVEAVSTIPHLVARQECFHRRDHRDSAYAAVDSKAVRAEDMRCLSGRTKKSEVPAGRLPILGGQRL